METKQLEDDSYAMDLYSRQIGAYGVEAMAKLVKMKVLVSGLCGVGIETAKNLALAGPGAITLHDDNKVEMRDLGVNFFLHKQDVGVSTRAEASMKHLQELNRLVRMSLHSGELTEDVVRKHNVLVATGMDLKEAVKWNAFCRQHNIGFIHADVFGASGFCFVDLGNHFMVKDRTGEQPVQRIIHRISSDAQAVVSLVPPPDGRRHNLDQNDHEGWITIDEVEGPMGDVLNGKGPFKIEHVFKERKDAKTGKVTKVFDAYSFRINVDTSACGEYSGGGVITQAKQPVQLPFRSLEDNLDQPVAPGEYGLLFTDGTKFGRAEQLHLAFRGLWQFQEKNGRLPEPNNGTDADAVVDLAVALNADLKAKADDAMDSDSVVKPLFLEEVDRDVVKRVATHAACELQPLSAFFGGVVAQEVVKITGKFTPLHQWLHLDVFEVLPDMFPADDAMAVDAANDCKPVGSRYDHLIMMFGRQLQEKLTNMRTFLVGCGALGCELLKNFAMLGLATNEGLLTVTDNDRIEVSNLSRQFLFREHNVGQPKSVAGAVAAKEMNPDLNIKSLESLVAPNTEDVFDDAFWESQDFVTNALDNVKARMYVDGQCVLYGKPLLESGTLGTKCNVQIIIPHLTQSYSDGPDDNDNGDAIPMCTLRNFPSQIEHCIEWSRAQFDEKFTETATEACNFVADPNTWLKDLRAKTVDVEHRGAMASAVAKELGPLTGVRDLVGKAHSGETCFADCVRTAYDTFHRMFRDKIVSLVTQYPADAKDENGDLFWSGTKRFPQVAKFDVDNKMHMLFVISMANLLAVNYGLQPADVPIPEDHPWRDENHVKVIVETFTPPDVVKESVDMSGQSGEEEQKKQGEDAVEAEADSGGEADLNRFNALLQELDAVSDKVLGLPVEAADFEKDADWNFHIDFITACSNMRAWNYRLKEVTRHKAKMIAGKIIPAIATTTASVTGLVMIELLKLAQNKKLEAFKDSSNNLGINGFFFSEPVPPLKAKDEFDPIELAEVKCKPPGFTKWDKTLVKCGDVTLEEFLAAFKAQTGLTCTSLFHKNAEVEGAQGHSQLIYESMAWKKSLKEVYEQRQSLKLKDVISEVYGTIDPKRKYVALEVSTEDDEDQVFKVPAVIFYFA